MNTTETISSTPQSPNHIVKPFKFPPQPQEWKIISLKECPTPEAMQMCETPAKAADYWRTHIAPHPYFNPECECLVVLILNTRRRIKGNYFVSVGTMDTILVSRALDSMFRAFEKTDLVVVDCRAASTEVFFDYFDLIDLRETLQTLSVALTLVMPVNHEADIPALGEWLKFDALCDNSIQST